MKRLLAKIFALVLCVCITQLTTAQTRIITGKVTDSKDGSPISGATVQVKGARSGTSTNSDGSFSITVPETARTLVVSYVGFGSMELSIAGKNSVDAALTPGDAGLNEVVVVGYGSRRVKDLTGSVVAVTEKDFNKGVITSPEQLLQGRTAGVNVTPASGEPGAGVSINVRGTNSIRSSNNPLFVVDGVPLDGGGTSGGLDLGFGSASARNPLSFLNPNDIESITILKDASAAAIYGARGANGVVLITTKVGRGKPSLQFNASTSISKVAKKYDLLNAQDFVAGVTQAGGNGNDPTVNAGSSTNWQDEILRTGVAQNYNVSYGGSKASTNYRISLGYFDQTGIIKNSGLQRFSGRINLTQKLLKDKLKFDINYTGSQIKNTYAPISDDAGFQGSLLGASIIANPTYPIKNADGIFSRAGAGSTSLNPVAMLEYIDDKDKIFRNLINVSGSYEIIKGLVYKATFGYDNSSSERKTFADPKLKGLTGKQPFRGKEVEAISSDKDENGRGIVQKYTLKSILVEHNITYDKEIIDGHDLNAVAGFSYQRNENFISNDVRWGVQKPGELIKDINAFKNSLPYKFGDSTKTELQSYFGRINYTINNRYYLTGTLRVDGSSKFGSGNKYGAFPALAAKWKLSNERFFSKASRFIDELSIRANWGITGNQEFPAYASLSIGQFNFDGSKNAQYLGNSKLKWEQTKTTGLGVDYSFFKGRLKGNIDYYRKDTKDLLFLADFPQPGSNNFQWVNLPGIVRNDGLEFGLNFTAIQGDKNKFSWDIGYNMTFLKNTVLEFGANQVPTGNINGQGLSGAFAQVIADGLPLFTYKMPVFLGYDKNGRNRFGFNGEDRFLGSALPKFTAGLTNNFTLGKWSTSIFINAVTGFYVYNNTANAYFLKGSLKNSFNVNYDVVNSNEDAFNTGAVSSRFLEKGDFLRLSNASIGYTFQLNKKSVFKSLGLNVAGQNLLLITRYSGIDPEVNVNKARDNVPSRGIDYGAYPSARTYTFGLTARF
jgi:TonB-dependent starch-binding outer membrane protein SusC